MHDQPRIKAQSGTNQEGTSAHNRRVIVNALRKNGQLSRAELARATSLTKQTLSNIMDELERNGLVVALAPVRNGRGQPSVPYCLAPEGAFAIGLQIDRHVTRTVVVDLIGTEIMRAEASLPSGGPETGVPIVLKLIAETRSRLRDLRPEADEKIVGLGVAMPGPFGLDVQDDDEWMMSAWQNYPLVDNLTRGTGLDVALQNDSAAAATAEKLLGAAKGLDHAVCIYLGYGLGAGLIVNGDLYRGAYGNAGEIGMLLSQGLNSGSDMRSPMEHRVSMAALCDLCDLDDGDPDLYRKVDHLVDQRDTRVLSWVSAAAYELRFAIQMLETLLDPQSIILCGGLPLQLGDLLVQQISPLLPSLSNRKERLVPRLQLGFTDPFSVAIGAAVEPISRAFDPRFSAILKTDGCLPIVLCSEK